MAGYIGSKSSVTQVDGYSEAEADAEFVNDPNGAITVDGSNVGIGRTPVNTLSPSLEMVSGGSLFGYGDALYLTSNLYYASGWKAMATGGGASYISDSIGHRFYTSASASAGAAATPVEKVRIDSSGNLLVGQTSANATNVGFSVRHQGTVVNTVDSQAALELRRIGTGAAGSIALFRYASSIVGSIAVGTNSTAYNTSSDYRLKENVVDLTGASARVNQLNPSRFNFIADADTTVDGFLAHEVATVVPEAIHGTKDAMMDEEYEVTPAVEATYDEDGNELTSAVEAVMGTHSVPDYQGIDQSKLVPLLTAALQEALTEIASLKTRVEALEA